MRYGKRWGAGAALVLFAAMLLALGATPAVAKIFGKKKDKEKQFVPFVPSGAWEAYIHDAEGRDRALLQPVEKNDDQDWMSLQFTPYKGPLLRLAIMGVENKSPKFDSEHDEEGGHEIPLNQIEDIFSSSLFNTHRFSLIERKRIQSVIAEQNVGSSDRINPASAVKVGKLLGADYLIIVAVNEWTPKKSGYGAGPFGEAKAEVAISFRVLNAATGELTFSSTERATAESWNFVVGGKQAPITYSLQSCLNKGAYRLATSLKVQPWRGSVAEIKGNKIYINAGSNRGIATGMKLTALSKGESVIDPETGLPLGSDTEAIGTLMVTTVSETYSIAAISQGCKGLKKGDQVEIAAEKF
jgi:curli biogenesis system outer membrane secretion channel CsgG